MKLLLDTNIILDLLLDRQPFSEPAAQLIARVERAEMTGLLCATSLTTIHYLLSKNLDKQTAITSINNIMTLFEVAAVNDSVIQKAINAEFTDFEDAVLHESAIQAGAQYLITRNGKDFKNATIPILTATEFLSMLVSLEI